MDQKFINSCYYKKKVILIFLSPQQNTLIKILILNQPLNIIIKILNSIGSSRLLKIFKLFHLKINF